MSYLKNMNFRRIVDRDYVPAASLGGMTYGASALEMTSAYAALENDGIYRNPTCIVRITDMDGQEVVGDTIKKTRVYEENAARMMTDVLKGVLTVGTARKNNLENAIAAGKTGTADDKKDGWFVGYTAYYTTGIWVGCDLPKAMEDLSGSTYPLTIWKTYMDAIHEGLEIRDFISYSPVEGTYVAPDVTVTPKEELTPTPEPAKTPEDSAEVEENTSAEDAETADGTALGEDYRVSPPPSISWGDDFDPTEDPQ